MSLIHQLASRKIQTIGDHLDRLSMDSSPSSFEIDFQEDGILITDSLKRHFLINYHGVAQQIWYSSALSGAHHFALKNGEWHCTRTEISLNELLSTELSIVCQKPVVIYDAAPDLEDELPDENPTDRSTK